VNLQAVKALVNGAPKRLRVCASCIKTGKITRLAPLLKNRSTSKLASSGLAQQTPSGEDGVCCAHWHCCPYGVCLVKDSEAELMQ